MSYMKKPEKDKVKEHHGPVVSYSPFYTHLLMHKRQTENTASIRKCLRNTGLTSSPLPERRGIRFERCTARTWPTSSSRARSSGWATRSTAAVADWRRSAPT